ncbi:MAG: DUF2513 domain-containing protein [Armatimonadetes bacterium]|nr:DUF2513 domain-containing protein [Armatimonadota bacterium]
MFPTGMTMEGHDFLDAARHQSVWDEAKARAKPLGSIPIEIFKALLMDAMKKQLGI